PSLNQNFMQPPMTSLEDINDPTEAINATLILFAKAFQLTTLTNNNQRTSSNPRNRQIAQPVMNMSQDRQTRNVRRNGGDQFGQYARQVAQNQQRYNAWQNGIANQNRTGNVFSARAEGTGNENQARCYNCRGLGHIARNCTTRQRRRDATYLQTQLLIAQKEEAWIQLQAKEFDFMAAAGSNEQLSLKISSIPSLWSGSAIPSNVTQSSAIVAPGLIPISRILGPCSNNITSFILIGNPCILSKLIPTISSNILDLSILTHVHTWLSNLMVMIVASRYWRMIDLCKLRESCMNSESEPSMPKGHEVLQDVQPLVHLPHPGSSLESHRSGEISFMKILCLTNYGDVSLPCRLKVVEKLEICCNFF
nr:hypothetical protein [Tanacetum cinerariifolium]